MNHVDDETPIRVTSDRWIAAPIPVIVTITTFLVSAVFAWAAYRNEAINNLNSIKILEARVTTMERKWDVMFEKVITIESNVSWMTRIMAENQNNERSKTISPSR